MNSFDFLNANTAAKKMEILEEFIAAWYGPRAESYGDSPAALAHLDLPMPLRRFYQFAGRWPARVAAEECGMDYFYTGAGYHHLLPNDGLNPVKRTHDGFIEFYMEYQGDWDILTKPGEQSSEIWLRGCWDGCDPQLEDEPHPTTKLPIELVDFLISHILFTSMIEFPNNPIAGRSPVLEAYFQKDQDRATLIWEVPETEFPFASGQIFQLDNYVFVWKRKGTIEFGSNHPDGVRRITALLAEPHNGEDRETEP